MPLFYVRAYLWFLIVTYLIQFFSMHFDFNNLIVQSLFKVKVNDLQYFPINPPGHRHVLILNWVQPFLTKTLIRGRSSPHEFLLHNLHYLFSIDRWALMTFMMSTYMHQNEVDIFKQSSWYWSTGYHDY